MTVLVDMLATVGAGCVVCSAWLVWMFWRSDKRATKTARPGASSPPVEGQRTPGLAATSAQRGAFLNAKSPGNKNNPAGQPPVHTRFGRDTDGKLIVFHGPPQV